MAFLIPLIFWKYNRSYVENWKEDELQRFRRKTFSILNQINIQSPQSQKSTSLKEGKRCEVYVIGRGQGGGGEMCS